MDPSVLLILRNLTVTGLFAAAAAGGLWLLLSLASRKSEGMGTLPGALALLAGYLVAHDRAVGGFRFPPNEALDWLPWLFAGFLLVLGALRLFRQLLRFELALFLLAFGIAQRILVEPVFSMQDLGSRSAWIVGSSIAVLLLSVSVLAPPPNLSPARRVWPMLIASAAVTGCQLASGSARIAELQAGVTGALAAGLLLPWIRPTIGFSGLAAGAFLFPTVSLLFVGHFFGELSLGSLICLGLALLASWIQVWFPAAHREGWKGFVPGSLLAGIPALASFAFAPL